MPPAFSSIREHDAPCAVCYTPNRNVKITIPARTLCPASWTREYYGYLMSDKAAHHSSKAPVCVDVNAESVPGSGRRNSILSQFFFMEITCTGTVCPPYFNGACVVCTK